MITHRAGDRANPLTHGGTDRAYKYCKCHKCHVVAKCTISHDFYTLVKDGTTGPLYCESCVTRTTLHIKDPVTVD